MNVERMRRSPIIHGPRQRLIPYTQLDTDPDIAKRWLESVARALSATRHHRRDELTARTWRDEQGRGAWFSWELR